jgi:hypothetical protein
MFYIEFPRPEMTQLQQRMDMELAILSAGLNHSSISNFHYEQLASEESKIKYILTFQWKCLEFHDYNQRITEFRYLVMCFLAKESLPVVLGRSNSEFKDVLPLIKSFLVPVNRLILDMRIEIPADYPSNMPNIYILNSSPSSSSSSSSSSKLPVSLRKVLQGTRYMVDYNPANLMLIGIMRRLEKEITSSDEITVHCKIYYLEKIVTEDVFLVNPFIVTMNALVEWLKKRLLTNETFQRFMLDTFHISLSEEKLDTEGRDDFEEKLEKATKGGDTEECLFNLSLKAEYRKIFRLHKTLYVNGYYHSKETLSLYFNLF